MNVIGPVIGVDFANALAVTAATRTPALPGFSPRRRGADVCNTPLPPAQDLLDEVPYTIIEQAELPPMRTPRAGRSDRRAAMATRSVRTVPQRAGHGAAGSPLGAAAALSAYAPYEDYLGFYVDAWV